MLLDNKNIKQLDGIRGISILIVYLSHIGLGHLIPGGFGVTVFFFISGFLIAKLLLHEIQTTHTINFVNFYIRRAFRLYPALLFFTLAVGIILLIHRVPLITAQLGAALFYFENYFYVYFINYQQEHPLWSTFKILWSLSIEEHYYLFYPLMLFWTYKHSATHILLCTFLLIIPLLFRFYYVIQLKDPAIYEKYNYSLTHTRIDSILYGSLLAYLLYMSKHKERIYSILRSNLIFFISLLGLLLTFLWRDDAFRETLRYTIQGICLAPLIVHIVYATQHKINASLFANPILVYIGKLSYSIYLFHWLAIPLSTLYFAKYGLQWQLSVTIFTLVFSLFSYYKVEMPFVKLRKKFGSNV